jgi:hypothetical protein
VECLERPEAYRSIFSRRALAFALGSLVVSLSRLGSKSPRFAPLGILGFVFDELSLLLDTLGFRVHRSQRFKYRCTGLRGFESLGGQGWAQRLATRNGEWPRDQRATLPQREGVDRGALGRKERLRLTCG